jgi:hypothetical protein
MIASANRESERQHHPPNAIVTRAANYDAIGKKRKIIRQEGAAFMTASRELMPFQSALIRDPRTVTIWSVTHDLETL